MGRSQRRAMIDREEPKLSLVRQCALLGISRSSLYYLPTEAGAEDLELMALIDQQYLKTPFYGSRRMTAWLRNHGHQVNRKRVRRLMQLIGLEAIYRRPNTSKPNPGHKVYPYLLRGLEINRVNQVWATDITYIPMARGFLYLVAIMDWHSRYVLAWRLSNTLEVDFCVAALEEALSKGRPQIFNTDQGSQFTSEAFTSMLLAQGVQVSMDGRGRCMDNVTTQRVDWLPRPCGDRPPLTLRLWANAPVAPHEWAIGHTFEFTFSLPKPANRGGHPHNWNKPAVKTSRKATPMARKPKPRVEPTPEQIEAQKEARRAYEKKRNQTPERKELKRRVIQEKRNEARSLGLCITCHGTPIPDQTRCETCAENNRVSRRQSQQRAINERD